MGSLSIFDFPYLSLFSVKRTRVAVQPENKKLDCLMHCVLWIRVSVSRHWHLPNVKPDRLATAPTSAGLPGTRARAEESRYLLIVVAILMPTGRAAGPGAVLGPAWVMFCSVQILLHTH